MDIRQEFYNRILAPAGPKPVALAEVGALPSLAVLERQPRWCCFMVWSGFIEEANPLGLACAVFGARRSIPRDDPRQAKPFASMRAQSGGAGRHGR
jgi:hypothetical protein